jgi:signal transduction histidine kinase
MARGSLQPIGADGAVAPAWGSRPALRERDDGDGLDAVVYRISHDLKAPVRALRYLPQWVIEDLGAARLPIPPSVANSLDQMQVQSARLQRFIDDLLTYSRVGRTQRQAPVDIASAIAGTVQRLAIPAGFEVRFDAPPGFSPVLGARDVEALLDALIGNAVKHHDKPRGRIDVTVEPMDAGLRLTVADDGPGLRPEERERAFAFMSGLRSRDEVEGSGMGLPIAEKVCAAYGGALELESLPERQGCRFTATLRAAPGSPG